MKKSKKQLGIAIGFLVAFAVWTVLLRLVDVRQIGPQESAVGFAALNGWVRDLIGEHLALYTLTDYLSVIPFGVMLGFALMGAWQWIRRKSLWRVDRSLLALGIFYIVMLAAYLLFEVVELNYRPVLIEGRLEASYPSSTTVLVTCVMLTAWLQLRDRIRSVAWHRVFTVAIWSFTVLMVVGRVISGVHWITDIIGGLLLSVGLVMLYAQEK